MRKRLFPTILTGILWLGAANLASATDLDTIKERGVLRHLGIPYANFVTGSGDGLDVEVTQRFAKYLGVRYEYVESSWERVFGDLTGKQVPQNGSTAVRDVPIRGDLIASGLTVLPWREKLLDYSDPTFPSAVWLIARADSKTAPIAGSGNRQRDIAATKTKIGRSSLLVKEATCLDPALYDLNGKGLDIRNYARSTNPNEMVPAILNHLAEMTLLDVPDALMALEKWPGQIKVIGPISDVQIMAAGFRKSSPDLRQAFNAFLESIKRDGTYASLTRKYYPTALRYFPEFFAAAAPRDAGPRPKAGEIAFK
jgi:ABC-type amino acid transport substrate-binding protein